MQKLPIAAGKSSFNLIDSELLFKELELSDNTEFLDFACGTGIYSMALSQIIEHGHIFSLDLWKEGVNTLIETALRNGIHNINGIIADGTKEIPLKDNSIDICLAATVIHDLKADNNVSGALLEIKRVLRIDGKLAIIEFNKIDGPPGPPKNIRISPEELRQQFSEFGFHETHNTQISEQIYLSVFDLK